MWSQHSPHALPPSDLVLSLKNHPHTIHSSQALLSSTPRRRPRLQRKSKHTQPHTVTAAFQPSPIRHIDSKQQQTPSTLGNKLGRRKDGRTSFANFLLQLLPRNRPERGFAYRKSCSSSCANCDVCLRPSARAAKERTSHLDGDSVGYSSWYQTCLSPRTNSCKDSRSNSASKCFTVDRHGGIATQPTSSTKPVGAPTNINILTGDERHVPSIIYPRNEIVAGICSEDTHTAEIDTSNIEAQAEMTTQTCSEYALATGLGIPATKAHAEAITQTNLEDLPTTGKNMSSIKTHSETNTQANSKNTLLASQDVSVINTQVTVSNSKLPRKEDTKEVRQRRKSFRKSGDFLGVQGANPRTGCWDSSTATNTTDECYVSDMHNHIVHQRLKRPPFGTQIAGSSKASHEIVARQPKSNIPKPCSGKQAKVALGQQGKESDTERRSREVINILEDIETEKEQRKQQEKQRKRQAVHERKARIERRNEMSARRRWVQSEDAWTSITEPLLGAIGQQLDENVNEGNVTTTSDARCNSRPSNPHTTNVQTIKGQTTNTPTTTRHAANAQTTKGQTTNIPTTTKHAANTRIMNTVNTRTPKIHTRNTKSTNSRSVDKRGEGTPSINIRATNMHSTNFYAANLPISNIYTTSTRAFHNENRQSITQRASAILRATRVSVSKDATGSESSTETVIHYNNATTNSDSGTGSRTSRTNHFLGQQHVALKGPSNGQ
ncbi:hypothetical protein BGZ60DRAFT_117665 [Tricladium varicosporioides]|nr:hypothetical protein BGZ60DRAFT_117665 [Hymenoscyphus varicosporioides]